MSNKVQEVFDKLSALENFAEIISVLQEVDRMGGVDNGGFKNLKAIAEYSKMTRRLVDEQNSKVDNVHKQITQFRIELDQIKVQLNQILKQI